VVFGPQYRMSWAEATAAVVPDHAAKDDAYNEWDDEEQDEFAGDGGDKACRAPG